MSAIFGIVNQHSRPVNQTDLQPMYQTLAQRGPDSCGFWYKEAAGLGHAMFVTTPEALHEKLPYHDAGLVITADARIDNREALIKKLGLHLINTETLPDSYFILCAYKKWGSLCVNHLLGDFSFAIWNERDKRLFCARDHMGIKPFNYYQDGATFVFATEVPAVLKAPGVPREHNKGRIADSLIRELEGYDQTSTFFQSIYRLPPAHTLLLENGQLSIHCYWTPDPEKSITLGSDEEYAAAFTEIYTDAVNKRLRGNNDVASMLSGGMDSSSIVGIARNFYQAKPGNSFPVFSATSERPECRESHYINTVLKQGGLSPNKVTTDELSLLNDEVCRVVKSSLEPFDPMIMIITLYLKAQQSGYRVMLDGIEGDLACSLPTIYPAILLKNGNYKQAIKEIIGQKSHYYDGRLNTAQVLYQNLRAAYTPSMLRKMRGLFKKRQQQSRINDSVLSKTFAREVQLAERLGKRAFHGNYYLNNNLSQSIYDLHSRSILTPSLTAGIERYDRAAAQCGIEPRHPLLDKRIIEFMLAIPWEQKSRYGWTKYLLRKTAEQVLPREVCWRKGWEHIGWDFETHWLQLNGVNINEAIGSMLSNKKSYFNVARIRSILDESSRGQDRMSEDNAQTLLELHHLASWFKLQE